MLRRTHVEPFVRERGGALAVDFLRPDADGRIVAFLDRLCRLAHRLEDRPRSMVREALDRQERRIGDAKRLRGLSKSLLDRCDFRPPEGAERAAEIREALFVARGEQWPPVPGDQRAPYERAAERLGLEPSEIDRLLYADHPTAKVLERTPSFGGRGLLDRYNLDLARGVLLEATRMTLTAAGGWRDIFRAIKLARLMYRIEPADDDDRAYRVELTGPAAPFLAHPQRYGTRFARVVPALTRAPGWRLVADIERDTGGRTLRYTLDGSAPLGRASRGPRYDSEWERALAAEFADKLGREREGWTLAREQTPVAADGELFLPDFTLRHEDGRAALVEIVGFWAPGYLEAKLRKVRAAGLDHMILVVYRRLAAGAEAEIEGAADGPVLWFVNKPRIGPVMEAAERVAR